MKSDNIFNIKKQLITMCNINSNKLKNSNNTKINIPFTDFTNKVGLLITLKTDNVGDCYI